jgi:hypothetical protein
MSTLYNAEASLESWKIGVQIAGLVWFGDELYPSSAETKWDLVPRECWRNHLGWLTVPDVFPRGQHVSDGTHGLPVFPARSQSPSRRWDVAPTGSWNAMVSKANSKNCATRRFRRPTAPGNPSAASFLDQPETLLFTTAPSLCRVFCRNPSLSIAGGATKGQKDEPTL